MNPMQISHGAFVIERHYPVSPARVFAAWTDPAMKARWFRCDDPSWELLSSTFDVRTGGSETAHSRFGPPLLIETRFSAHYHEVVPNQRLVYAYDMHLNAAHHSVSLVTVEMIECDGGTRQRFHEHVAFLDGTLASEGVKMREQGTAVHMDLIGQLVA